MNMTDLGPMRGTYWAEPGARSKAKRLEMLDIDIRYSEEWVATMRSLVQKDAEDEQFTIERMAALKAWERRRKLAQHNLHYKYDPTRRRARLVDRDVKKMLESVRARLEEAAARRAAVISASPALEALEPPELAPAPEAKRESAPSRPMLRSLTNVNAPTLEMIKQDIPKVDLERATDAEIIAAYVESGTPAEAAEYYVGLLGGASG